MLNWKGLKSSLLHTFCPVCDGARKFGPNPGGISLRAICTIALIRGWSLIFVPQIGGL